MSTKLASGVSVVGGYALLVGAVVWSGCGGSGTRATGSNSNSSANNTSASTGTGNNSGSATSSQSKDATTTDRSSGDSGLGSCMACPSSSTDTIFLGACRPAFARQGFTYNGGSAKTGSRTTTEHRRQACSGRGSGERWRVRQRSKLRLARHRKRIYGLRRHGAGITLNSNQRGIRREPVHGPQRLPAGVHDREPEVRISPRWTTDGAREDSSLRRCRPRTRRPGSARRG